MTHLPLLSKEISGTTGEYGCVILLSSVPRAISAQSVKKFPFHNRNYLVPVAEGRFFRAGGACPARFRAERFAFYRLAARAWCFPRFLALYRRTLSAAPPFASCFSRSRGPLAGRSGQKSQVVAEDAQPDRGGETLKSAVRAAEKPIRPF
jgi:hypothetical protein